MSVQYENLEDNIAADEDECSIDSADGATEDQPMTPTRGGDLRVMRIQALMHNRWPLKTGILHLVWGILMVLLGLAQIVLVPMLLTPSTAFDDGPFQASNNYGIAIWAGLLMVLSGSLGIRASIYRNMLSIYIYFIVILVEIVVEFAMIVVVIVVRKSWAHYGEGEEEAVHLGLNAAVCTMLVISYAIVLFSFMQYYEDVCFGELQLCRRCLHCCVPCWCPRAVEREELLAEEPGPERPPSLPV